jgi:PPOX class probable F420-dependent enzyme
MPKDIPAAYRDLLDGPVVAALATHLPDGQIQVNPVWLDATGEHLRVNTARGRQKAKNLSARQECTLLLIDPANPYRYLEIRGRVVGETEDGARAHIDVLAKKYLGKDTYPFYQGETRVMYLIEPTRITTNG